MKTTTVLLAALLCLTGCPHTCDASSCAGCCDDAQECQLGSQLLTCGGGGERCSRCAAGEVCAEHACQTAVPQDAGPGDGGVVCRCLTGCCGADGACKPGNLNEACGVPWGLCASCGAQERCANGTCTTAPCKGCLDAVGACQPGTALDACGSDAGLCEACLTDQTCVNGSCRSLTCSASNCGAGCCAGTSCITVPSNAQCGLSGGGCVACVGTTTCIQGGCR